MAGVAYVELAETREGEAGAARTGRHHAIEHIDAARDRADDILGTADAHQIARVIGGQEIRREIQHAKHLLLALADREAADRIAVEADTGQSLRGFLAEIAIDAALHDAEEMVA